VIDAEIGYLVKISYLSERKNKMPNYIWKKEDMQEIRVIDGDTIQISFHKTLEGFGFKATMETKQTLRLARINAPERGSEGAKIATEYLTKRIKDAKTIKVVTYRPGKFGRYIIDIFIDSKNINSEMLEKGIVQRYGKNNKGVKKTNQST